MPNRVGGQGSRNSGNSMLSKPVDYVTGLFWGLINFGEFILNVLKNRTLIKLSYSSPPCSIWHHQRPRRVKAVAPVARAGAMAAPAVVAAAGAMFAACLTSSEFFFI